MRPQTARKSIAKVSRASVSKKLVKFFTVADEVSAVGGLLKQALLEVPSKEKDVPCTSAQASGPAHLAMPDLVQDLAPVDDPACNAR